MASQHKDDDSGFYEALLACGFSADELFETEADEEKLVDFLIGFVDFSQGLNAIERKVLFLGLAKLEREFQT